MRCFVGRSAVASVTLVVAAGCFAKGVQPAAPGAAAGWTLPGGNLQNTRDVASSITGSNVSTLGVAWCVPIESTGATGAAGLSNGYAATSVVVNGVVYAQDLESNVMAIELATGKVLWTHTCNSLNGGPDGGAERQDRRAGMELGRGAEPVRESGHQLRRRPVGSTVVRQPGQHLRRSGEPRPDRPDRVAQGLSMGDQPAGAESVYRLGREAESAGSRCPPRQTLLSPLPVTTSSPERACRRSRKASNH